MRKHIIGIAIIGALLLCAFAAGTAVNAYVDFVRGDSLGTPATGKSRLSVGATSKQLTCTNDDASSCLPSGGGGFSPDVLSEAKAGGTLGSSSAKAVSVANNATQTILNLTGQSGGYVGYIWLGVGAKEVSSTLTITTDSNTVFNDRYVLFFGAEYQENTSSFTSRFIGASNNNSNNVGVYSFIPIPFNSSISIAYTNLSGGTESIWYTISYQTGVARGGEGDTWPNTRQLHCASGTISAAMPYSVNTLVNASGLNQGRMLGMAFSIDAFPGSANPATAPLEGEFKFYIDGGGSPSFVSSGTEDYIGYSNYFQGFDGSVTNTTPNAGFSVSPYTGLTFNVSETWNAYRFHIMDPVYFTNALKVTWDAGEMSAVSWTGTVRFAYCLWYYTQ